MNKHTPGEWRIAVPMTGDDLVIESQPGLNYHELARVRAPQYSDGANRDEMRANARLISAAPELLEALIDTEKHLAEYVDAVTMSGGSPTKSLAALLRIRAALAKAKGDV